MNLKGEILYKDHLNTQRRLFYDFSINPSDLIRLITYREFIIVAIIEG